MSEVEIETVTDRNGVEKQMVGRPTGLRGRPIPTGDSDLDWRCPDCGEVGFYRVRRRGAGCTNPECRVDRFSPWVGSVEGADDE